MAMKILRATHLGMCFGVRDAITLAKEQAARAPLTVYGDLVHNETVLDDLRQRGIRFARRDEPVAAGAVLITAHGASRSAMDRLKRQGLEVSEATCPLVRFAHNAITKLVREGFHPVIIGQRDHVEVRGLTEDLVAFDVVLSDEGVDQLGEQRRYGVAAQTTQPIDRVRRLVERLRRRFPVAEVRFIDTVCQPTKQRQDAAVDLARQCDVVIVVGGAHSNNTRELVATCQRYCARVHHIQNPDEIVPLWLEGASVVGLTAGTSTPDAIIDAVEERLRTCSETAVERRELSAVS